jgi:tetratricopeptide (TPR) repeat protein
MKILFKTSAIALLFTGVSVVQAMDMPLTSLTKNCKSMVNKNLKIKEPALQGNDERTYKKITRAQENMAEEKYDEAILILNGLLAKVGDDRNAKNDFQKAQFNQLLAYAYAQKGESQASYPYFKEALKYGENSLPNQTVQQLRENVASFMYTQGDKQKAIELLKDWFKKSNVEKANVYYLLAAFYAETGKFKEAVCPSYLAAKVEDKPKKTYLQLMLSAHYEMKDLNGTATILKLLAENFPEDTKYWRQLSQIYYSLEKIPEALAVQDMFYLRGKFETETDYKTLAQLFSYQEVPYRAAKVLEEGINKGVVTKEAKNWRNVARYYHSSNQLKDAIRAYGETAVLAEDGKDFLKQAELLSDDDQWQLAIKAFDKAIEKGGLDDDGRAYLRKGVALINLGSCSSALKALDQASKYKKHRKSAMGWTNYANERIKNNKC